MSYNDSIWETVSSITASNKAVSDGSNKVTRSNKERDIDYTPTGTKSLYITKNGAFIKFSYLHDDIDQAIKMAKKIENFFTLRSKTITGALKLLKCCTVDKKNKRIIVPRFGIFEILGKKHGLSDYSPVSQIKLGDKPYHKFKWKGTQTHNQKLISDEIMSNYYTPERVSSGSAGVILNLEAGQGKSYLAAYLISVIQKKTAIILHTTALVEQWAKVLTAAFGDDVSIGYYYAKKKKEGDIMIMIVDSAANDTFTINKKTYTALEYYNQFGFIIYDECHIYSNKTALKCLKTAQTPYMLGLSATPDEHADKYDIAVWWSIGPVLDASKIDGFMSTSDDFTAKIHRVMYYGPEEYTKNIVNSAIGTVSVSSTINMLCEDEIRNQVVINCIQEGLELGLYMFVFADRREYLTTLRNLLQYGEIVDNDDDFVRIVGGAKSSELEAAEVNSKVIFTTYQYMGTGKSVIKMNGLVLATPRRGKMKQYINRVFRLGSDATITRHVWDICDMKIKLANQWSTRKMYYESKNYPIISKKILYTDVESTILDAPQVVSIPEEIQENEVDNKRINNIVDSLLSKLYK